MVSVVDLALLPLNYFLELGFFFVVGITMTRRLVRAPSVALADLCAITFALTSVLICSFLRSSVISNNDLGWRGFLVAQFVLVLWGAELWDEKFFVTYARRGLIATLLLFGIAGTVYEVSMVRFYTLIADRFEVPNSPWFDADRHVGERTYALRALYEDLQRELPVTAVLQHNPDRVLGDVFHGMYADRQTAVETPGCGVVFGGEAGECTKVLPSVSRMFDGDATLDWDAIEKSCRSASIDAVVVKDSDRVWRDAGSWVWRRPPFFANRYGRAFLCNGQPEGARQRGALQ
jgi:hypothetical protein